jgi:hypothetical protein
MLLLQNRESGADVRIVESLEFDLATLEQRRNQEKQIESPTAEETLAAQIELGLHEYRPEINTELQARYDEGRQRHQRQALFLKWTPESAHTHMKMHLKPSIRQGLSGKSAACRAPSLHPEIQLPRILTPSASKNRVCDSLMTSLQGANNAQNGPSWHSKRDVLQPALLTSSVMNSSQWTDMIETAMRRQLSATLIMK